ncbi:patched domain-containing protein 3-like [Megalops cyprinoides]|uniref:patched domain-containing protein 3-like n=1 Tax=Megalops cyprinoides TaxID=118141 RepID=UPI001864453E|nr:patched domain-containing protein 3-like [Megalops cyprinoides]
MECRTHCIERPISRCFGGIGRFVGRYPWVFLFIPLLVSAGLGGGFYYLEEREANDIEDQFTPVNGPAKMERQFVQENFNMSDSDFSYMRLDTEGTYASLIVVSKSNILTKLAFNEIISLDRQVKQIKAGDGQISYESSCATIGRSCVSNTVLDIVNYNASKIEDISLTFPFYKFQSKSVFLGTEIGGVKITSDNIESAEAIRLFYFLREDNSTRNELWLKAFIETLSKEPELKEVSVSYFTSISRQEEFEGNSKSVIPFFSITYTLAITFSIISCMRLDSVRNKVWVATFGVLSAGLAVLSSFGMLLYIGMPFAMTVATAPFLILGIGVDNTFIMISFWQRTHVHDSVEDRLAETYKEAAVSITITTLTDALAFYIGLMTPFRSVQSFCMYTSTAVLFCYLYNITFFGAFMALNGRREKSNRHWLTCMKIPKPGDTPEHCKVCCMGGAYDKETGAEVPMPVNDLFKEYYGPILTNSYTKVLVILLYAGYLAGSIYGCRQMEEGIDLKNLAADGSYVGNYYDDEDSYFSEYGPNVMVVVKGEYLYWDETSLSNLDACLERFESLPNVNKEMTTPSWLQSYEIFGNQSDFNLKDEKIFKEHLPEFLQISGFQQDVNFTNGSIYASRFFIPTVNIVTSVDEKKLLNELRETAEKCEEVPLLVYHPAFIYYDQYAVIVSNTIQNVAVATAAMLVISLLLIPNPLCSLWVTFAIASVIVGVAGFMALWDVNLDSISMINLVICIGFSVDFSAHISYAFVSSSKPSANEKAVEALFSLGYPIVQGAVSTILGVVVLSASKSYIFRTFFKIMFLVILFGMVHGIVFIPVFLTLFGCCGNKQLDDGL